jgi:hypothetical protein
MLLAAAIFLFGLMIPVIAEGHARDYDLVASGFVTLCVSTWLFFRARSHGASDKRIPANSTAANEAADQSN